MVADGVLTIPKMDVDGIDFSAAVLLTLRVVAAGECEHFQDSQVWVLGPILLESISENVYDIDLDGFSLGYSGPIEPGTPEVTPDPSGAVQVDVKWPVVFTCPCDKILVTQEVKGYVELTDGDGNTNRRTAMSTAVSNAAGFQPGFNAEADDIRTRAANGETGEDEFIPDFGAHGSSTYPPAWAPCEDAGEGRSRVTFNDQPGSSMRVGPTRPFRSAKINLTFRTHLLCDGVEIGVVVWHLRYDVPTPAGTQPDVGLGE